MCKIIDISEVLESAHVINDDKARRVLNTAPDKQADITLKEIEQGVTIEQLETLTVPVYQYSTQITIHGTFKDIPSDLVVAGYKSVILNQNKSLGVKYIAIDGMKKRLLEHVSYFKKTRWDIYINSQGCEAIQSFHSIDSVNDRQRCIDCYKSTPDNLYIGSKEAGALMYGGYAVILHIGAIYQANLWQLIKELTGIESQSEYDKLESEYNAKRELESRQYEIERKAQAESDKIKLQDAINNFIPPSNWIKFTGKIETVGTFARIYNTWRDGIALQVIKTAKRGAYLCTDIRNFTNFEFIDWKPQHYSKGNYTIDGWQILDKPQTIKTTSNKPKQADKPLTNRIQHNNVTISHNEALNGIELRFKDKPSNSIINTLKSNGFRWNYKAMLWYNRFTDSLWQQVQSMQF